MSSTPSQVRIANRALILLGQVTRLSSFDDSSPMAAQVRDIWDESRRMAIACHPWNFALHRAALNEDGEAPLFGYAKRYALPGDCLRWLPPSRDDEHYFEGEQEGRYLLSDADAPLNIRYIRDIEDVTQWPPHFVTMMAYQLAMDLAESVTQLQANVDDMAVKLGDAMMEAKQKDGLATGDRSRGNVEYTSRWNEARIGYGGYTYNGRYLPRGYR